jgi:hypothetical protein
LSNVASDLQQAITQKQKKKSARKTYAREKEQSQKRSDEDKRTPSPQTEAYTVTDCPGQGLNKDGYHRATKCQNAQVSIFLGFGNEFEKAEWNYESM